ncbi:MAG: beta-lactamase family protein [Ruminococcus sp.]|nr:beta-lactamase family protein [Ruminococcus sp.]
MKKIIAAVLLILLVCSASACSSDSPAKKSAQPAEKQTTETTRPTEKITADNTDIMEFLENLKSKNFSGIIYAEKDGKTAASYANGKLYKNKEITLDTPMPVGSISKQFCGAAIMLLQERDKLSVNDTLDKYYPEYKYASKITLHDMLCMRSGIPNYDCSVPIDDISMDNSDEENTGVMLDWVFSKELDFEPDEGYEYSNLNYTLLSNIVEKLTGKNYIDFLRENFLTPLGMNNTGSIFELKDNPEWAEAFSYQPSDISPGIEPGMAKGAGDIISNAHDMTIWMNALPSGKVVSEESYKAMTTDFTKAAAHYGYGLTLETHGGTGHGGIIGYFNSYELMIEESDITVFITSNQSGASTIEKQLDKLVSILTE